MPTNAFSIRCPACGGADFHKPGAGKDEDLVCAGCGRKLTLDERKAIAIQAARKNRSKLGGVTSGKLLK